MGASGAFDPGFMVGDRGTGVGCVVSLWDFGFLWVMVSCLFPHGGPSSWVMGLS